MSATELVGELKDMGLTGYEALCYISLARLGPSDPRKVASDAGIPHPNAYQALQRLAAIGWAERISNKPAVYRARKPTSVKDMVTSRVNEAFEKLDGMYKAVPTEEAELVYTLRGREKVLSKIYEMMEESKRSLVLVTPTMGLSDRKLVQLIQGALERRVAVRVIGDDQAAGLLPKGVQLRMGNLVAVDVLVDDEKALISLPDYSACGWVDSPQVARHFKQFLELMWNSAAPAANHGRK